MVDILAWFLFGMSAGFLVGVFTYACVFLSQSRR
jgi:hypothetical protein